MGQGVAGSYPGWLDRGRGGRLYVRMLNRDDLRLALTFDDVLLLPGESDVLPKQVETSTRLTRTTLAACSSTVRFLWMKPSPPCWAMAMAMADSVTVSIAEETMGTLSVMFRVSRVLV